MKMLAVAPHHALPVERISALLWPDERSERLTQRVHQLVYLLRSALRRAGGGSQRVSGVLIQVRNRSVRIDPGLAVWTDAGAFESRLNAALADPDACSALEQTLALYRGPLLAADPPDDWLLTQRLYLERRYLAGLRALADRHGLHGRIEQAVGALRSLVKISVADEDAHRQLILLYGRLGRRQEVERQLSDCRLALAGELGTEPDDRTLAAYRTARHMCHPTAAPPDRNARAVAATRPVAVARRFMPPRRAAALLGRRALLDTLGRSLADRAVRVLALTGEAGIGKSAAAVELARDHAARYGHGACWIPLAGVPRSLMLEQIRHRLQCAGALAEGAERTIARFLADKHLLLVLDHVDAVHHELDVLAAWTRSAPGLTVVTTSRQQPVLPGTRVFEVPALSLRGQQGRSAFASPALQLLLDCARAQVPDYALALADTVKLGALAHTLHGVPLSLRLAACRAAQFAPDDLCERLAHCRSLEDVLAWSCGLLGAAERRLLGRLGLFCGSFDDTAVAALCRDLNLEAGAALTTLAGAGLIVHAVTRSADGPAAEGDGSSTATRNARCRDTPLRFRLEPAVAAYAARHLAMPDHDATPAMRLATHFADRAARAAAGRRPDRIPGMNADHLNFFRALELAQQAGQTGLLCRLALHLGPYWGRNGCAEPASHWLTLALDASQATALQSRLHCVAAGYFNRRDDPAAAQASAATALRLAAGGRNPSLLARAALLLSQAADRQGDKDTAVSALRQALAAALGIDDFDGAFGSADSGGEPPSDPWTVEEPAACYAVVAGDRARSFEKLPGPPAPSTSWKTHLRACRVLSIRSTGTVGRLLRPHA